LEVISEPRDRNKPRSEVSFRYDPLRRRISKTSQQQLQGRAADSAVTTRFVWEGYRLLQEIHDGTPLTYVYSDSQSYEPLARIDGVESPELYWFHNAANGMPELLTDSEGQKPGKGLTARVANCCASPASGCLSFSKTCVCRASTWSGTDLLQQI